MLIVSLALFVSESRGGAEPKSSDQAPMDFRFTEGFDPALVRKRTLKTFFWIFGTLAAIWLFGFLIAIPVIVFLYTKVQSREGWILSLTLAGACWLMIAVLFDRVLHLPFPAGIAIELLQLYL